MRELRRQDEGKPEQQERQPGERVVLERARETYSGATREVLRVSDPRARARRSRQHDSGYQAEFAERTVVARNDQRIPGKKTEGKAG